MNLTLTAIAKTLPSFRVAIVETVLGRIVFASSDSSGYFAEFSRHSNGESDRKVEWQFEMEDGKFRRQFERVESATQILGSDGYCWGIQDKLCQAVSNAIKIVKYNPWNRDPMKRIREFGIVPCDPWNGDVISAATANFGVIVELENAMLIFPSEGNPITLPGEPVNWRVFPRSRHYENQLHVIYDDRLEILSFNQDYLVDQSQKLLGTYVSSRQAGRGSRSNSWLE